MNKNKRMIRGMTLIEVLVVIAIMGLILPLVYRFLIMSTNIFTRGAMQANVQHNVRIAAAYINTELKNAQSVKILKDFPNEKDPNSNYIYVDGSTIKHIKIDSGLNINIINEISVTFKPQLKFSVNDKDKQIIKFIISAVDIKNNYDRNFDLTTEVKPMNLDSLDIIEGESEGSIISFTNPLNDSEIVRIDKLNLDIQSLNPFLVKNLDSSFQMGKPSYPNYVPNVLYLPTKGKYGSNIEWTSDNICINASSGKVYRSKTFTQNVVLKATFTKGSAPSVSKEFTIKVEPLDSLVFVNSGSELSSVVGEEFSYFLNAIGGNPGYYFYTDAEGIDVLASVGLVLEENGLIHGIVTQFDPLVIINSITFNVTVKDSNVDTTNMPDQCTANGTVTILIN